MQVCYNPTHRHFDTLFKNTKIPPILKPGDQRPQQLSLSLSLQCPLFSRSSSPSLSSTSHIHPKSRSSPSPDSTTAKENLTLNGGAVYRDGVVELTDETIRLKSHAFYPSPIQFKNSTTANVSSFSTCFVFSIQPEFPNLGGHGFTFAIATNKELNSSLPGQYLGLLNDSDSGVGNFSNHIFAVEFDTVSDPELGDIDDNHVGIDINSLVSNASASTGYHADYSGGKNNLDLKSGEPIVAWVDYDSITNLVNVTLSSSSWKPTTPLLSLAADLTPILREEMYVGFSASTGLLCSSHYILWWSFKMMGESKPLDWGDLPSVPPRSIKKNHTKLILTLAAASLVFILLAVLALIYLIKRMKPQRSWEIKQIIGEISSTAESLQYDLGQIRAATADFSDANKLGRGGFGVVYRGEFESGQKIAVKRLSENSEQGNAEFKNEVLLVAKLQHRNLVRLLGFTLEGRERLLVYEFVPNASLDHFIFDPTQRSSLDWDTRIKIIQGVVRGLVYLHVDSRLRIIHRDLKPSNILLDGDMNPKIADFGMARLSRHDETQGNTNKIVGTYGYMAPEYAMHGEFSIKSDVFSFGVLILEIISGRRNKCIRRGEDHVEDLLTDTWGKWWRGTAADMIDPLLQNSRVSEMLKCIHIGLLCVQENATNRPTMTKVLRMLDAPDSTSFPLPSEPAFYTGSTRVGTIPREHNLGEGLVEGSSRNEMSFTELYPR